MVKNNKRKSRRKHSSGGSRKKQRHNIKGFDNWSGSNRHREIDPGDLETGAFRPLRTTTGRLNNMMHEEEIHIVSNDHTISAITTTATSPFLSHIPIINAVPSSVENATLILDTAGSVNDRDGNSSNSELSENDTVGFFLDDTPLSPSILKQTEINKNRNQEKSKFEKQMAKIIKDDTIYIEEENGDGNRIYRNDNDDDNHSISSSEDISMLTALSHWGNSDTTQFEALSTTKKLTPDEEEMLDYAELSRLSLLDIYDSDASNDIDDEEEEEEEEEQFSDTELALDMLNNVPEGLKNSYRGLLDVEKRRLKHQQQKLKWQQQRKRRQRKQRLVNGDNDEDPNHTTKNSNLLDHILNDFMLKEDVETLCLTNLTNYGRSIIVPKIAELFKLGASEINSINHLQNERKSRNKRSNIKLLKMADSCIPDSCKRYLANKKEEEALWRSDSRRNKRKGASKGNGGQGNSRSGRRAQARMEKDNELHGQVVASNSAPISSQNIGHRMLSAMGWTEGSSLGGKEDGITEPIKAVIRAKRRGLGA